MNNPDLQFDSMARRPAERAWPWAAACLTIALIGLAHDLSFATASRAESVEAGRHLDQQTEFRSDVTTASLGRKLGFFCLISLAVYCLWTVPSGRQIRCHGLTISIVAAMLWTFASVFWSNDPSQTIREFVRLFVYLMAACALALRFDAWSLCLILISSLLAAVSISFGVEVLTGGFKPWIPGYRLGGTMHSAGAGIYAILLVLGSYILVRHKGGKFWWGALLLALSVLFFSKALTSFLACGFGLAAYYFLDKPRRFLALGTAVGGTLMAVCLLATAATDFWSAFRTGSVEAMGRDYDFTSLNGRIPLWNTLCEELHGRWLQGFGYAGFWTIENIERLNDRLNWYAGHAHSGYLGIVVHVGLIGFLLVLTIAVWAFLRTVRLARRTHAPEYFVFGTWLATSFFISITESTFIDPRDIGLIGAAIVFSCTVSAQPTGIVVTGRQKEAAIGTSSRFISKGGFL